MKARFNKPAGELASVICVLSAGNGRSKCCIQGIVLFILLLLLCNWTKAQQMTISGLVTAADDGNPLPGVNVFIKGTTIGTATDSKGTYVLSSSTLEGVLIFSFIGFQTQEVEMTGRTKIDSKLIIDVLQLSEIIVTGTGVPTEKQKVA